MYADPSYFLEAHIINSFCILISHWLKLSYFYIPFKNFLFYEYMSISIKWQNNIDELHCKLIIYWITCIDKNKWYTPFFKCAFWNSQVSGISDEPRNLTNRCAAFLSRTERIIKLSDMVRRLLYNQTYF